MRARKGLAQTPDWRVYFVTDTDLCGGPDRVPEVVAAAIRGGSGVIQVRDKALPTDEFAALTRACLAAGARAFEESGNQATFFVNDRLEVASELGLHVHLGQSDAPVARARELLGSELLVGLSISSQAELAAELADPVADVIGLSPIWATPTKTDTAAPLGLAGASQLVAAASDLVTVAIGGINHSNAAAVAATGVTGICVVSAIASAPNPEAAARDLLDQFDSRRTP